MRTGANDVPTPLLTNIHIRHRCISPNGVCHPAVLATLARPVRVRTSGRFEAQQGWLTLISASSTFEIEFPAQEVLEHAVEREVEAVRRTPNPESMNSAKRDCIK